MSRSPRSNAGQPSAAAGARARREAARLAAERALTAERALILIARRLATVCGDPARVVEEEQLWQRAYRLFDELGAARAIALFNRELAAAESGRCPHCGQRRETPP